MVIGKTKTRETAMMKEKEKIDGTFQLSTLRLSIATFHDFLGNYLLISTS